LDIESATELLIAKSDWRATNSSHTNHATPNIPKQNFEIAILFSVVERSESYVFEDDKLRKQPSG